MTEWKKINDLYKLKHENSTIAESFIVIVATGVFDNPKKPSYPIPEEVKNKVFFRIPKELPKKRKKYSLWEEGTQQLRQPVLFLEAVMFFFLTEEKFFRINEENLKELEKKKKTKSDFF